MVALVGLVNDGGLTNVTNVVRGNCLSQTLTLEVMASDPKQRERETLDTCTMGESDFKTFISSSGILVIHVHLYKQK